MQKIIRASDEQAQTWDAAANAAGLSFESWARQYLDRAATGPITRPRYGYKGIAENGATITIKRHSDGPNGTGGGAANCSQEQFDAYQRAHLLVSRNEPGDRERAAGLLQAAGFDVFEVAP
jgi:hypothetical protein